MRRSLSITAFCLFALLVLLAPVQGQDGVADWTYMQYFNMDNNLELNLYNDLTEMQAVGSSDRVNFVAQVDRIPEYETRFGDWTDTRRFLLQYQEQPQLTDDEKIEEILMLAYAQPGTDPEDLRQQLRQIHDTDPATYASLMSDAGLDPTDTAFIDKIIETRGLGQQFDTEPVETLGEVDMGDSASLADFVIWAIQNYPAQHYALTISTHGAGWLGNGPDETDDADVLQLPEIVEAFQHVGAATGVEQFDIIGFDACLMAQLEVYEALAPYTRYVIASEEVIPGNGWEYVTPFSQLVDDPTMTAEQFGTNIIDAYMAYYAGPGARTKVDLHLIDTSEIPAVVDALGAFAAAADQDMLDKLSALGVARTNAQIFGTEAGDALSTVGGSAYFASVDLVSLMELVAGQADIDPELVDAALAVSDAAQAAVVHGAADAYLPDAHGMAIYFPTNARLAALPAENVRNLTPYVDALPDMGAWSAFLASFHSTIDTALTPDDLQITITQVLPDSSSASIYDPPVAIFDTNGAGIASLAFTAVLTLDDGTKIMVDYSPLVFESVLPDGRAVNTFPSGESSGNSFAWNVETLMISDGTTQIPALLFINNPGTPQGAISGTYVSQQNGQEVQASVVFDTTTRQAISTFGVTEDGAPYEINVQPSDKFFPNWYSVTSDGLTANPPTDFIAYGLEPFSYSYAPAASGSYTLTMIIQDLAGNTSVSSADLHVDNTDLDPNWRGFKDVERGINFLYPWGWSDPTQLADDSGQVDQLVISDPDGTMLIYVAMRDEDIDSAAQTMIDLESGLTDAQVDEPVPLEDDPQVGQWITYTYTGDDGEPRAGAVIVIWSEENEASYTFDVDVPEAQLDAATTIIQQMYDSLTFFPPLS